MSPTVKALLLEAVAELVATCGQLEHELTKIFATPGSKVQALRDLAKRTREAKHSDVK